MAGSNSQLGHLLRRAGFGGRPDEYASYGQMSIAQAVDALVNFDTVPDDVDTFVGKSGYLGTTSSGAFSPNTVINDARQRWIFRMVHTNRPLQEKMALFWHNHFATGYLKVAGASSATDGTRYMAAKPSEDANNVRGQIEMLRTYALGNFRDILMNIAKDTAMLIWLDGRVNTKDKPQENFGREVMELFTVGVGNYTEPDVYAAARVFTGWGLTRTNTVLQYIYNPGQHETTAKTFSFPVYGDGAKTIPARSAANGAQDGEDFINGLAGNPNTARYLAGKLWKFFVSEFRDAPRSWIDRIANTYLSNRYEMRPVMREVLLSAEFWDQQSYWARYSWPIEFVVRSLKEVGWSGFSANSAIAPLSNMGQILFEPPDVAGWDAGQTWFATGAALARMNFAATLTSNQKFNLATTVKNAGQGKSADALQAYFLDQLSTAPLDSSVAAELGNYLRATGAWTGSDAQLQAKSSGLVHLIVGSPEYQLC
jgi:uncharacterized protein (DUF1800 family)